jgi:sulfide:quinone oxidoreductase
MVGVSRFRAVICGGGIAGFEGLLRLRRIAGENLDITVIAPNRELQLRPDAVLTAFRGAQPRRVPVERITGEASAEWVCDALAWVDRANAQVHTSRGDVIDYDGLLLAVGGSLLPSRPGYYEFSDRTAARFHDEVVRRLAVGSIRSVVFVVPSGPSWPIPLYELALLMAGAAARARQRTRMTVCTSHSDPLPAFGGPAGDALRSVLDDGDVELRTNVTISDRTSSEIVLQPDNVRLPADVVVTLPQVTGPNIRGIPGDGRERFLPVDAYCKLINVDGAIFAAGDATNQPVKHGSVGAQQADEAAAGIAHAAGIGQRPEPLRPVIRAVLLTAGDPLYLQAHLLSARGWQAEINTERPWPTDAKVVAEELDRYLHEQPV